MTTTGTAVTLNRSLALVAEWLRAPALSFAAATENDPFKLDLPPLLGPGQSSTITASGLRSLAALYMSAEVDQTGVLVVAEALAQARDQLQFLSVEAARTLDEMARDDKAWDRARREALYARTFGLGGPVGRDGTANNGFVQAFTSLCTVLVRYETEDRLGGAPSAAREAALRYAASAVLFNLAPRQSGVTTLAAMQIHRQLQQAVAILSDRSILAHFSARDMWDAVRRILGNETPDITRIVRRAESGVRIFDWIAGVMAALGAPPPSGATRLVPRGAPVFVLAAQWLEATGVPVTAASWQGTQRSAVA